MSHADGLMLLHELTRYVHIIKRERGIDGELIFIHISRLRPAGLEALRTWVEIR